MLLNRVILKYCTEEAGKEAFACARTPRLRLRLHAMHQPSAHPTFTAWKTNTFDPDNDGRCHNVSSSSKKSLFFQQLAIRVVSYYLCP